MIITLKGANFANSNIGTLDSYSIRFVGSGVTNSNTSVDRESNTGYTTTITLGTGYELNGSITVTMGGTDITSTAVSGLTITIPTKVTGNVVITVPTKNTAGGGDVVDPEPENPGSGDAVTSTTYYFKDRPDSGYLNGGELVASTKSSTTDYIDISSKPKIGYFGRMGYVAGSTFHAIEFYDANKTYLSSLSVLGDGKEMTVNLDLSESKYANAKYVRASVSQSSFTTEQFNSWYFVVGSFIEEEKNPTLETVTSMFPNLGYLDLSGNDTEATSGAYITDYVSLSGKTNITYKGRMGTIGLNMAFYDSSKNFISGLETVGNGSFITLNINLSDSKYTNAAYVKASISKGSLDETTWLSSSFKIS